MHDLYEIFSNENSNTKQFLEYLPCNIEYIIELKENQKNHQKQIVDFESERSQMKDQLNSFSIENNQLKNKLTEVENERDQLNVKLTDTTNDRDQLKRKLADVENERDQLKVKLTDTTNERDQLKRKFEDAQNQLKSYSYQIRGTILATVKSGLVFNAVIQLKEKGKSLDKTRSKYIVSTVNVNLLGAEVYKNGELITALNQTTLDFIGKSGTYYVRALIVDHDGKSTEIVSNPVTVNGAKIAFSYDGQPSPVVLAEGKYKMQVWGASGGCSKHGAGGLGGYSEGIISFNESTKLFIYVGGQGRSGQIADGSETQGGFPDGGGTKTGHCYFYKTVPGTGGGSTSVRISSDSPYARVIVAGGGGGASGSFDHANHGGFGGGLSGGNCYYSGSLQNKCAGTQIGSTPHPGNASPGAASIFGHGANGLYKRGCDSGGGGGGGGSGWVFTSASYQVWSDGDSSNSSHFLLNKSYYLTNASTKSGNEQFPSVSGQGNEKGHQGNGYAIITPQ